jgi:hypothetical protein
MVFRDSGSIPKVGFSVIDSFYPADQGIVLVIS